MSTLCVVLALGFTSVVEALIETKYGIHNSQGGEDFVACGQLLQDTNACAGRFTKTTCEPMTDEWCMTKDMSDGATYMTKKSVVDKLEDTLVKVYNPDLPIEMREGTHVEVKVKLVVGWHMAVISLKDKNGNVNLRSDLKQNDFFWYSQVNDTWTTQQGYFGTANFKENTEYAYKIVCRTNNFQIYLNGVQMWIYPYTLPPESIKMIMVWFSQGSHLYYVSYMTEP